MPKLMIVKVQLSIGGNRGRRILAYDKKRKFEYEGPADEELVRLLGGKAKQFYWAYVDHQKQIQLQGVAPWQEW